MPTELNHIHTLHELNCNFPRLLYKMSITLYGSGYSLLGASYPGPHESYYTLTDFLEYWTLKMTALQTVETSKTIYPSTPRNIPDDLNLYNLLP